jgi:Skp family chaperone for outer membrane proteins
LQKEDQELAKQRSLMEPDAFKQKIVAFQQKAAGVQKEVREKRQTFTKAYENAISQLHGQVTSIISALAKERGFKLAVPTSQILYNDPSLDISSEVLARLNKQMPSLTVKF